MPIAVGLLLALSPASALGQSGEDQYRENVPDPGGEEGAPPPEPEASGTTEPTEPVEPTDDSTATSEEPAEEVVEQPAAEPAPDSTAPETLPVTGPDAGPLAISGAALLLLGAGLLAAAGRPKRYFFK